LCTVSVGIRLIVAFQGNHMSIRPNFNLIYDLLLLAVGLWDDLFTFQVWVYASLTLKEKKELEAAQEFFSPTGLLAFQTKWAT